MGLGVRWDQKHSWTIYIWANRAEFLMNLMVASKIHWLSSRLNLSLPYKRSWSKLLSSRKRVLYLSSMGLTVAKRTFLGLTKLEQLRKKWQEVSAIFGEQLQKSLGVSSKLCALLWLLRGLKPTRSWKIHLIPTSNILNKLFFWRTI